MTKFSDIVMTNKKHKRIKELAEKHLKDRGWVKKVLPKIDRLLAQKREDKFLKCFKRMFIDRLDKERGRKNENRKR